MREALLGVGLWVKPLSERIQVEGLETVDDLRYYFGDQEAASRAGHMVGLAWSLCRGMQARDRSMEVLQSRLSSAEGAGRLGRVLARPSLATPRRAQVATAAARGDRPWI